MPQATIVITDECNCKIQNLDLSTRRTLQKKFSYEIPGARFTPAVKLGRWDGKKAFCSLGTDTYINLLPEMLPILDKEGYDIILQDMRQHSTSFAFPVINESSLSHMAWPKGHVVEGQPIMLRDYQVIAINEYLANPQGVQSLPTGAGKTIITGVLSLSIEPYGRSVVIVPSKDLVRQTEADYINLGLDVGVLFGDRKDYTKTHTICTWQSLNAFFKREKDYLDLDESAFADFMDGVVCVIVDECFAPGTLVLTPTGYVKIETLKPGDRVVNFSENLQQFKVDEVVKLHKNLTTSESEKMYELEFDNGKTVTVTGNHKFLTNRGWVRADELTEDDEITSLA